MSVVLVPGAPVMVPELSGTAAAESSSRVGEMVATIRREAVGATAVRVVGADPDGRSVGDVRSTLARWGADVPVGRPGRPPAAHRQVPDAALIAWWLLDLAGVDLPRSFTGVAGTPGPTPPAGVGELVVVAADGPASLTPRAPVPEDPRGVDLDARLVDWLRSGGRLPDPGEETGDRIGWWSRPAWYLLAALTSGRPADSARSWAPFGVGYHHAVWHGDGLPPAARTPAEQTGATR